MDVSRRPLAGLRVVEIAGGASSGYCTRLLREAGASVSVLHRRPADRHGPMRADVPADRLYAAYLADGKAALDAPGDEAVLSACAEADLVIVGEDASFDPARARPRLAVVGLTWFGDRGPYRDWKASDLVVQALTGTLHLAGEAKGPPLFAGDRSATIIGGVTAYIAALSGVLAPARRTPRAFTVNILEANLVTAEMSIHFVERDGVPLRRHGINRFSPNGPVGIYPCRDGWVGIIATTPEQWRSLCSVLELSGLAADEELNTREKRFLRLDEVEDAMVAALAGRDAEDWAARGRKHRVPIVPVPNAAGILSHPIFTARRAFADLDVDGTVYRVPAAPFARGAEDGRDQPHAEDETAAPPPPPSPEDGPPLAGLTVADFSMGWAGPLATRLLADLGATVLKIEAGRYPDWWRGVNWSQEYIDDKLYENAKGFCALNRGKRGISIDLTTEDGRALALALVAKADAVVENQAAGVMAKLGLSYDALAAASPRLLLLSMSAFGSGNPWSDTRAYGSTLEQGSGLPSFMGRPGTRPTMAHLAYGDPVGGLFGCAALLTALAERRRTGRGRWINYSMVEAMLQFTTPSLLEHQRTGAEPPRRGNRHPALAPHGVFRCAGEDQWLAVSVEDGPAFAALARLVGRDDWAADAKLATLAGRRAREDEIEAAVAAWCRTRAPEPAAMTLQTAGVAAAPVKHTEDIVRDEHLERADFFIDLERQISGPQRQAGIAITQDGRRLGSHRPAPLLGEHSWEVLQRYAGLSCDHFDALVAARVISFAPTSLRSALIDTAARAERRMAS